VVPLSSSSEVKVRPNSDSVPIQGLAHSVTRPQTSDTVFGRGSAADARRAPVAMPGDTSARHQNRSSDSHWTYPTLLLFLILLCLGTALPHGLLAAPPLESPATGLRFSPTGTNTPPSAPTLRLQELLDRLRSTARPGSEPTEAMIKQHMADLEQYLLDWPDSPWNPSVRDDLARLNLARFHHERAIDHWQTTFSQFADSQDPIARHHANSAFARFTRQLASIGRSEELESWLATIRGRPLDDGPLENSLDLTRQWHVASVHHPELLHVCGTAALGRLAETEGWAHSRDALMLTPASRGGFSLADLYRFSEASKLPVALVSAQDRLPPVPSVALLRIQHFVVILDSANDRYRVFDPSTGGDSWVPAEDLLAELTGHYLAAHARTIKWPTLSIGEAEGLKGRVFYYAWGPEDFESCTLSELIHGVTWNDQATPNPCFPGEACHSGCTPDHGAAAYISGSRLASGPFTAVRVEDWPLVHQTTFGPGLSPLIYYQQLAPYAVDTGGNPTRSLTGLWSCSWFMHARILNDAVSGEATFGGAQRRYSFASSGSSLSNPHPRDGSWLERVGAAGAPVALVLHFQNGRRLEFSQPGANGTFAVTKAVNSLGHDIDFIYDELGFLWKVRDADGNDTVLTYNDHTVQGVTSRLLHRITLPTAVHAEFGYTVFNDDRRILLTSIRDAVGIVSQFSYPTSGTPAFNDFSTVPISITVPHGTSSVDLVTGRAATTLGGPLFNRVITLTHPDGSRERYAWNLAGAPFPSTDFSVAQLPVFTPDADTGIPAAGAGTFLTTHREFFNSFHWGARAMADLAALEPGNPNLDPSNWTWTQFSRARITRWLNPISTYKGPPIPNHVQDPSPDGIAEGLVTFYDYPGKMDHAFPGSSPAASVVAYRHPTANTDVWTYTPHNAKGQPLSITSTWSDKTTGSPGIRTLRNFTYAANGSDLTEVRDGQNRLLESRTYNASRQVTQHRTYFGTGASDHYTTTYAYDPTTKRMTSSVSPTGLTNTWTYTPGAGNTFTVIRNTSPIPSTASEIHTNGRLTQSTDTLGLSITYLHDNLNRLTRITWPDQSTREFDYTRQVNGQTVQFLDVQRSKDRMGQWTTFTYDGARRLTEAVDPAGRVRSFAYCSCGQLESATLGIGGSAETTAYHYRADGRLTSITAPGGRTVGYTYNLLGQKISENDGVVTSTYTYNLQGQLTQANSPAGILARTVFDEEDRPWKVTDANGITVTRTYDLMGRPVQNAYPAVPGGQGATAESFAYPTPTSSTYTDQRGKITHRTFDAAGRPLTEVTPNTPPETVTHGYAANFLSRTLTDGRGKVTTWAFDTEGRLIGKRYHGQAFDQTTHTYRADGRVATRRYYSSPSTFRQTTYSYDASGNLTLIDYPAPTVDLAYTYDDKNRMATAVRPGLGTITFGYAHGRLIEESGPWANTLVRWNYPTGQFRQSSLQVRQNATPAQDWVQAHTYDSAGRLATLSPPLGNFTYSYTTAPGTSGFAGGLIDQVQLPGGGKINHDWDALGRLTLTEFRNNLNAVQNQHLYQYDIANRRTQQTRPDASVVNYGHDDLGQLTAANIVNGASTAYAYDAGWNMTNRAGQGYVVGDRNQVTSGEGSSYSYDTAGNRTHRTPTGGGYSEYGYIQYTYDDENQLIHAETDSSVTPEHNRWRTEWMYDGLRRLRIRTEYHWLYGGWYQSGQTRYVYDGRRVVQERNSGNAPTVNYVRGLDLSGSMEGAGGIGGLLARSTGYQGASGTWTSHAYYHADGGGNVTFLSPSTYTGTLTRYVYDAYGRAVSATGPLATANVYRFSSKELHAPSGLFHYGYRFYDPMTQRWMNRDPLGEAGGFNLYGFASQSPISHVDPHGLWPWSDITQEEWDRENAIHGGRPYELCSQVDRELKSPATLKASSFLTRGMSYQAADQVADVGKEVVTSAVSGPTVRLIEKIRWLRWTKKCPPRAGRLVTGTDEAVFWSGIGRGGDVRAANWVAQHGGSTLETTLAAKGIRLPRWDPRRF